MIENQRKLFQCSAARLRRARRLYGWIVAPAIEKNPEIVHVCARRAYSAGLYSDKTCLVSIAFSLCRKAYARSEHRDWGGFGWYHWRDHFGVGDIWNQTNKVKLRNGKPIIKLRTNLATGSAA